MSHNFFNTRGRLSWESEGNWKKLGGVQKSLRAWMGQRKGRTLVYVGESVWGAVGEVQGT